MKWKCGCHFCEPANRKHDDVGLPMSYLLEDDYTHEEFMADICTEEEPCDLCRRRIDKRI